MNGYDLTNKMRRTRRRYPLTATEQALYHELVSICNEDEWADTFSCSNQELCHALQITEKTLTVARLGLIQAGLLYYRSGQSKRQFGLYSFSKKLTTVKIPVDTTTDKGGDATTNVTANPTTNPTAQASDYIKPKPKETKPNSSSSGEAPGDQKKDQGITPEKTKVSKEGITPHWQMLVDTWFSFYKEQFLIEPSFKGQEAKNLKSILERLEKHSLKAGFEWTEAKAKETFVQFIQAALGHSDWLSRNFVLGNIASQFDPIINPTKNGHSKTGKQPGAAKVTGSGLDAAFAKRYS